MSRAELLNAIRSFVREQGYAPTIRELSEILGVGHGTVQRALADLISEGRITKTPGIARGISVKGAQK